MKNFKILPLLMALMGLSFFGHAQFENNIAKDIKPGFDLSAKKTYSWLPLVVQHTSDAVNIEAIDIDIINAIEGKMMWEGLEETSGIPDVYVSYMFITKSTSGYKNAKAFGIPDVGVNFDFGRVNSSFTVGIDKSMANETSHDYKFDPIAVVIQLYETKMNKPVWWAVLSSNHPISQFSTEVPLAVSQMFQKEVEGHDATLSSSPDSSKKKKKKKGK